MFFNTANLGVIGGRGDKIRLSSCCLSESQYGRPTAEEGCLGEILPGDVALLAVPHHEDPEDRRAQDPGQAEVDQQQGDLAGPHTLQAGLLRQVEYRPEIKTFCQFLHLSLVLRYLYHF